jgi:hypothetical protein
MLLTKKVVYIYNCAIVLDGFLKNKLLVYIISGFAFIVAFLIWAFLRFS